MSFGGKYEVGKRKGVKCKRKRERKEEQGRKRENGGKRVKYSKCKIGKN
jgi:hypothetical protein